MVCLLSLVLALLLGVSMRSLIDVRRPRKSLQMPSHRVLGQLYLLLAKHILLSRRGILHKVKLEWSA